MRATDAVYSNTNEKQPPERADAVFLGLGKSTLVGNRNHLPDQVLARNGGPDVDSENWRPNRQLRPPPPMTQGASRSPPSTEAMNHLVVVAYGSV